MRNAVKMDFAVIFQSEYHIFVIIHHSFLQKSVVEGLV